MSDFWTAISKKLGADSSTVLPTIRGRTSSPNELILRLRLLCPSGWLIIPMQTEWNIYHGYEIFSTVYSIPLSISAQTKSFIIVGLATLSLDSQQRFEWIYRWSKQNYYFAAGEVMRNSTPDHGSPQRNTQLRCFYAHAGISYNEDARPKPGKERFLVLVRPQSYGNSNSIFRSIFRPPIMAHVHLRKINCSFHRRKLVTLNSISAGQALCRLDDEHYEIQRSHWMPLMWARKGPVQKPAWGSSEIDSSASCWNLLGHWMCHPSKRALILIWTSSWPRNATHKTGCEGEEALSQDISRRELQYSFLCGNDDYRCSQKSYWVFHPSSCQDQELWQTNQDSQRVSLLTVTSALTYKVPCHHSAIKYKNVSAEPISVHNRHLLMCEEEDQAQRGQERFLVVKTPQLYNGHLRKILEGPSNNNFKAAFIYVDEFHETKSSDAPWTKHKWVRSGAMMKTRSFQKNSWTWFANPRFRNWTQKSGLHMAIS